MEQPKLDRSIATRRAVKPNHGPSQSPVRVEGFDGRTLDGMSTEYEISDSEVAPYLEAYPFLVGLLVDAAPILHRYFPNATLSLEIAHDSEVEDDRQLALVVASPCPFDELTDKLRRFDSEWWLDHLPSAQDRLFITLSFG